MEQQSKTKGPSEDTKSWELATLRKKDGKAFLVFGPEVRIMVGNREVDMGDFRTLHLNKVQEDLNFKLEQGWISEEKAEKDLEFAEKKGVTATLRAKLK
jgi:hypothetical protein